MAEHNMLTAEEAQASLKVSRATFWTLVKRYSIPRYTIPLRGKRVFFRPEDLAQLGEARLVEKAAS